MIDTLRQELEVERARADELAAQLLEARELLDAIQAGDVDAVVIGGPDGGNRIYTLTDADRPYRILIEEMPEGAVTLGDGGIILYANQTMADLLGVSLEDLTGESLRRFIVDQDVDRQQFDALLVSGGKGEVSLGRGDGSIVPVLLAVSSIPDAEAYGQHLHCAVITDLTQEKLRSAELAEARSHAAAEAARREGEGFARLIIESATDYAIIATDLDAIVTSWNTGAANLFGPVATAMIGQPVLSIWTAEDLAAREPEAEMARAAESGSALDERWHRRADGTLFWASGLLMPLRDGDDRHIGFLKILRDNSKARAAEAALRDSEAQLQALNETLERRVEEEVAIRSKTEDALRQSQKLEAVGQLTGGVAHDFNNLLTIIKSSTELLRRPSLAEEKRQRYVGAISDTVDRATKLTSQLLTFARRQALDPQVFDVAERIDAIADMLRTIVGSRIAIVTNTRCPDACMVEADISQFETALVNMAVNARDAMDGEGTLTITLDSLPFLPGLRSHAGSKDPFVAIHISDTGIGIPPETIGQVFEPFFTTKQVGKGTGLGLSQVYGFAKQSGGNIDVKSEPGKGAVFVLYLPRVERVAQAPIAPPERRDTVEHGAGRRVLVVEDNVDVGSFSTQLLQDLGYETVWAENATEALGRLAETPDGFDVVFTDVIMPGMSGIDLGLIIRRDHPALPVVLTSGYSHVLAEEGRHGFELLRKPYAVDELSRILSRVLHKAASLA